MNAVLPVPFVTTLSKAYLTLSLVSSLMTFLTTTGSLFVIIVFVSGSLILLTIYGLYKVPPFIAALTAVICWIGVTLTPWPLVVC